MKTKTKAPKLTRNTKQTRLTAILVYEKQRGSATSHLIATDGVYSLTRPYDPNQFWSDQCTSLIRRFKKLRGIRGSSRTPSVWSDIFVARTA